MPLSPSDRGGGGEGVSLESPAFTLMPLSPSDRGRGVGVRGCHCQSLLTLVSAIRRQRPWLLALQLRQEPVEAIEVVQQAPLHVVIGVADDADRSRILGVAYDLEQRQVMLAGAKGKDFLSFLVAVARHAVEIQAD